MRLLISTLVGVEGALYAVRVADLLKFELVPSSMAKLLLAIARRTGTACDAYDAVLYADPDEVCRESELDPSEKANGFPRLIETRLPISSLVGVAGALYADRDDVSRNLESVPSSNVIELPFWIARRRLTSAAVGAKAGVL